VEKPVIGRAVTKPVVMEIRGRMICKFFSSFTGSDKWQANVWVCSMWPHPTFPSVLGVQSSITLATPNVIHGTFRDSTGTVRPVQYGREA
jgi:hypothetical protein